MFTGETLEWEKNADNIFTFLQLRESNSLVISVMKRKCWMLIP